jgi:hypothetical protein
MAASPLKTQNKLYRVRDQTASAEWIGYAKVKEAIENSPNKPV